MPSWEDVDNDILELALKIRTAKFKPSVILAIVTGGVIPGKLLLDVLSVSKMRYIEVKFYRGVGQTDKRPVVKALYAEDLEGEDVLVVDDVSDTGETLTTTMKVAEMFGPANLKSATLYIKGHTNFVPDFFVKRVDEWIVFPWDKWETLRNSPSAPIDKSLRSKYDNVMGVS